MEGTRFKVGDRVRIKSLDWYYNRNIINEVSCGNTNFIPNMVKYCDEIVTISCVFPTLEVYHIKEDGGMFNWTDNMFEGLADTEPQEKMVSLEDVCKWIEDNVDDDILVKCGSLIKCMDVNDFILYFRKSMEK